jgi:hypothetical protein
MVNSRFIDSSDELLAMINNSYQELYDLLLEINPDYFTTSADITITTSGTYTLPATFAELKGLDLLLGGRYQEVKPFSWGERNRDSLAYMGSYLGNVRYRLVGNTLRIEPTSNAAGTYRLWYIPALTLLSADADVLDTNMTRRGWEQYIVLETARQMLVKEESNPGDMEQAKAVLVQRIRTGAANRDSDQPEAVRDTQNDDSLYSDRYYYF